MKLYTLICIATVAVVGCANAQESRPKPPSQLNGKSITVSYLETRKAKPEDGGEINTRKVPFKLIIYVSTEGNLFNRLLAGQNAKTSDQTKGARDMAQLADRETVFDKQKMTVVNTYSARKGSRTIEATFDETFSKCTATVVTKVDGEFVKRRLMQGGFELLYSASASDISCAVVNCNELQTN
jgi:hypothetical protein